MRRAHLVICRGGASTVCELSLLGAPAIIVPLPGSLDQDQAHNVRELNEKGGAWMVSQTEFTTEWLSGKLNELMLNIELLNAASARSLSLARPDADCACVAMPCRSSKATVPPARRKAMTQSLPHRRAHLRPFGRVHIVGIGGIGMSGIAEVMHVMGYEVQGVIWARMPIRAGCRIWVCR